MKLSLVIPVFNGAATVGRLVTAIRQELAAAYDLEFVLVNDGSPDDNSADVCAEIAAGDSSVVFLDL